LITVDAPWDKFESYRTIDSYKDTVEKIKNLEKEETDEEYSDSVQDLWQ